MLESIDIAANTAGNYVIEEALKSCKESISVGRPFHLPLSRQKEIPQMVSQMVAIGEQTGALDAMLGKIADFYEDEVKTHRLTAALQLAGISELQNNLSLATPSKNPKTIV